MENRNKKALDIALRNYLTKAIELDNNAKGEKTNFLREMNLKSARTFVDTASGIVASAYILDYITTDDFSTLVRQLENTTIGRIVA